MKLLHLDHTYLHSICEDYLTIHIEIGIPHFWNFIKSCLCYRQAVTLQDPYWDGDRWVEYDEIRFF
ncbi:MAG: hypothetical protein F6K41_15180 [Symploca sp. SIO3E6]|nr:hypothetical protein [Caldora sp. SIO3E6]